jgi:glutathione S-transferase
MPKLPLILMGAPGSPYTRKMCAALRYRLIPYRTLQQHSPEHYARPKPKVELLPTFYLEDESGKEVAVTDSTPLIRRFETEFVERKIVPSDPVLALLNAMLEDFGDEWLTKAMFHYRWAFQADIDKAAAILPLWSKTNVSDEEIAPISKWIAERQISRLSYVGSNAITAPVIEAGYKRFLGIFDAHLQTSPFLFGARPASADFALYGQLSALACWDPTPMAICVAQAPRVYAWTEKMDDLSGLDPNDNDWIGRDAVSPTLRALLAEFGRVYAPYLLANAAAVEAGTEKGVATMIDGARWEQRPFPYQAKCLRWLREEHTALSANDRRDADAILKDTGAATLFE